MSGRFGEQYKALGKNKVRADYKVVCTQYDPKDPSKCNACGSTSEAMCVKTHPWIQFGLKYPETPECDKMYSQTEKWNAIYPFIEWLYQSKKITLAQWRDAQKMFEQQKIEDEKEGKEPQYKTVEDYSMWHTYLLEHPYPIGMNDFEKLLYEYFEVDPAKLEIERRALLEFQRQLNDKMKPS